MRIKKRAMYVILQLAFALAAGFQARHLRAQSTDIEAKKQQVVQAKKIVQEIRNGLIPAPKDLDFLDDVLSHYASSLVAAPKPPFPSTAGYSEIKLPTAVVHAYVVDPKTDTLMCFWRRDKDEMPYRTIETLREGLTQQGIELKFAINGGIYDKTYFPKGLYIEQGTVMSDLDRSHPGSQAGNFYLEPNGVFLLDSKGVPRIITTDRFDREYPDSKMRALRLAIQSGPSLLLDGEINLKFAEVSANRLRRSGVGILADGRVIFAMSQSEISFRDFAAFFKDKGCLDALYLDGGPVPSFYVENGPFLQPNSELVTMFGVVASGSNRNRPDIPKSKK